MPSAAERLNGLYNDYMSDHGATADQFWPAVRSYVTNCLKSIPIYLQDDLCKDIVIEVLTNIDAVRLRVSFIKWLNGIVHNMRADQFRTEIRERASMSFFQSVIGDQDGMIREFEGSDEPWDEADLVMDDRRAADAAIELDRIRASLNSAMTLSYLICSALARRYRRPPHERALVTQLPSVDSPSSKLS